MWIQLFYNFSNISLSLQDTTLDTLRTLSSVADIVRPIAIKASVSPSICTKASESPDLKNFPLESLSSLAAQNPLRNLLPIQLAGLADIIIRNQ